MNALPPEFVVDPVAVSAAATVTPLLPKARFSLRCARADAPALAQAIGVDLPLRVGARTKSHGVEVSCLGPDEWMILTEEAAAQGVIASCAAAYQSIPHCLVEVTDREMSFGLTGPRAAEILTLGCLRDIAAIAIGDVRRTVFDGVSVILSRDDDQAFRLDVWRSFAPHVTALLATGCRELALEM
jgi:sarcosine oxidase subunit gamma